MKTKENVIDLARSIIEKNSKISSYEFLLSNSEGFSTSVRLGEIENFQHFNDQNFEINVFCGKRKGNSSTVDVSQDGLSKAIEAAYLIAQNSQEDPYNGLAPIERLAFSPPDIDIFYPWEIDPKETISIAKECEAIGLDQDKISNSNGAEISSYLGGVTYSNSNNYIVSSESTKHSLSLSLIASSKEEMETAYDYSSVIDATELLAPEKIGIKTAELASQKLGSRKIKSQKAPIIFTPRLASGLFTNIISGLSGSRQYRKNTFLLDSLGKKILPEYINIYENPLKKKTIGSKNFDSDGVQKQSQFFIKEGKVEKYILGQYSANQLKKQTTGNAGGVNNLEITSNLKGGYLELAKRMNKGFLVTELMGQGVNITNGNYSRGAAGFWVENGQISYPVSGVTIAGNLVDIFKQITLIGNDIDHRLNTKIGSILIDQMTIAGNN